jgi:hypothetical protein
MFPDQTVHALRQESAYFAQRVRERRGDGYARAAEQLGPNDHFLLTSHLINLALYSSPS